MLDVVEARWESRRRKLVSIDFIEEVRCLPSGPSLPTRSPRPCTCASSSCAGRPTTTGCSAKPATPVRLGAVPVRPGARRPAGRPRSPSPCARASPELRQRRPPRLGPPSSTTVRPPAAPDDPPAPPPPPPPRPPHLSAYLSSNRPAKRQI